MDLEQRVAQLERGNRRMKRIGALVLVVAAAALLSGQVKGKYPDLEVGSLTLKDKAAKTRARLGVSADGSPSLDLLDRDGKTRARLTVLPDGSPGLALFGKDGSVRATLGATATVDKRTGAKTKTTEGTLTLFDAKGDVIWQAPR